MYYRRALKLQAFLDMATEDGKTIFFTTILQNFGNVNKMETNIEKNL